MLQLNPSLEPSVESVGVRTPLRSIVQPLAAALLVVFSAAASAALLILNPGLFWDDWLWRYTSNDEFIRLGNELGVWWSGWLSISIWSLRDPVLAMRLTAFLGWMASGIAIALLLERLKLASRTESLLWLALYSACHVGLIRYLPSVAMYSVYIASFWVGWAVLAYYQKSISARVASAALLMFSFHLSSLFVLYGVLLAWLVCEQHVACMHLHGERATSKGVIWVHIEPFYRAGLRAFHSNPLVFLLPFIFAIVVKVPSIVLVKASQAPVNFYSRYNLFNPQELVFSLPRAIGYALSLVGEYVVVPSALMGLVVAGALFILTFCLMTLVTGIKARPVVSRSLLQLAAGFFLIVCGVFSYFVVGKPPILSNFYESRHVLVAIPGVCLVFVALAGIVSRLVPHSSPNWAAAGVRNAVLAGVVALSITQSLSFSLSLLVDWLRQQAILEYVKANKEKIEPFGLVIFDESTLGLRTGDRYIWNYEYTGMMLSVAGRQTHLGISMNEYVNSPVGSPLFQNPAYLQRYNARLFDIKKPSLILNVSNGPGAGTLSAGRVVGLLADYWAGRPLKFASLDLIRITPSLEFREADQHMAAISKIVTALEKFRVDNGYYPLTATNNPPVATSFGTLAVHVIGAVGKIDEPAQRWYQVLAPKYIEYEDLLLGCSRFEAADCGVIYISNGMDFKLLKRNVQDLSYVRQAYASSFDLNRKLYGTWTSGAQGW